MSSQTTANKHWWLYVLKCEHDKWYIGITSQTPEKRFQEHLHGRKSYWTEEHPPIKIADRKYLGDLSLNEAKQYENKVVRTYMRQKGVNKVRGGDLLQKQAYIVRFGYIFDELSWTALTVILFEMLIIAYLLVKLYF